MAFLYEVFVVFIIHLFRTLFETGTAGDAFFQIHIARMLEDLHLEISLITPNVLYIRQSKNVYVQVPADLDQIRRKNSHGTVIGGEGLIKLGHDAANGG